MPWMDVLQELYTEFTEAQAGRAEDSLSLWVSGTPTRTIGGMRRKRNVSFGRTAKHGEKCRSYEYRFAFAKQGRRVTYIHARTISQLSLHSAHFLPILSYQLIGWSRYPWADDEKSMLNNGLSSGHEVADQHGRTIYAPPNCG